MLLACTQVISLDLPSVLAKYCAAMNPTDFPCQRPSKTQKTFFRVWVDYLLCVWEVFYFVFKTNTQPKKSGYLLLGSIVNHCLLILLCYKNIYFKNYRFRKKMLQERLELSTLAYLKIQN